MRIRRLITMGVLAIGLAACTTVESVRVPACTGTVVKGCSPTVYFLFNSAEISPYGLKRLDWAVEKLKRYPTKQAIVTGYTDQTGEDEYNIELSRKRAEAARAYLIAQGIASERVTVDAKGSSDLVCDHGKACMSLSRRVTVTIQNP